MKQNSNQPKDLSEQLKLLTISSALLFLFVPSYGQDKIVIEGGPGEIQISDRDGKPEPVNPANTEPGVPAPVLPPVTTAPASVVQPVPTTDVKVRVPSESSTANERVIMSTRKAQTSPPALRPLSAEKSERLAELKRELDITETETAARATFRAEKLFREESTVIEETAKPSLKKLGEFMEISPKDTATISYHYAIAAESETEARLRAMTLVDHLSSTPGGQSTDFTILEPEPIITENPVQTSTRLVVPITEPMIEITLK